MILLLFFGVFLILTNAQIPDDECSSIACYPQTNGAKCIGDYPEQPCYYTENAGYFCFPPGCQHGIGSTTTLAPQSTSTLTPTTSDQNAKQCENGWTSWNGNCYIIGQGSPTISGTDAELKCDFLDAELTDIDSPEELQFLGDFAKPGGNGYLCVGLRRINGQFLYKNGTSIGYVRWCKNEPEQYQGLHQSCGFLEVTKDGPCVGDNFCSTPLPRYICKKQETVPETRCESGWKFYNGNCYKLHGAASIDANDAENACVSMAAEATDINTEEELNFIGRMIRVNDGGQYPLVGLRRINNRFLYKNGTSIGFIKWCPGFPKIPVSNNDVCAYMEVHHHFPTYCIADTRCNGFTSYVCKKKELM